MVKVKSKRHQFLMNYTGAKFNESKEIINIVNLDNYDTIIEPFGGSFGYSRYVYYKLCKTNMKFIIYDCDKDLIDFYKKIQDKVKDGSIVKFVDDYNRIVADIHSKCPWKDHARFLNNNKVREYIKESNISEDLKKLIINNLFRGGRTSVSYKKNCDFGIFNNIEFKYGSAVDIDYTKFNNKTLIYLDPPYLVSDNTQYVKFGSMDRIFETIDIILKNNQSIFIHSYAYLLHKHYIKYYKMNYSKTYGSGNKVQHYVYLNLI